MSVQITPAGKSGCRPFSPAAYQAAQQARQNPVYPEDRDFHPNDIPKLLRKAGPGWKGFADVIEAVIASSDWGASGWKTGEEILVRITDAQIADRCGTGRTAAQARLRKAIEAGLVRHVYRADWSRRRLDLSPLVAFVPRLRAIIAEKKEQERRRAAAMTTIRELTGELRKCEAALASTSLPEEQAREIRLRTEEAQALRAMVRYCKDPAELEELTDWLFLWFEESQKACVSAVCVQKSEPCGSENRARLSFTNPPEVPSDSTAKENSKYVEMTLSEPKQENTEAPGRPETLAGAIGMFCKALPEFRHYLAFETPDSAPERITMHQLRAAADRLREKTGCPAPVWQHAIERHGLTMAIAALVAAVSCPENQRRAAPVALLRGMLRKAAWNPALFRTECLNAWPTVWTRIRQREEAGQKQEASKPATARPVARRQLDDAEIRKPSELADPEAVGEAFTRMFAALGNSGPEQ